MSQKSVFVRTDASGDFSWERSFKGTIRAIEFQIGDLSTPDIDVTDDTYSLSLLSVNGVSASTVYYPSTFLEAADGTTAALVGTAMKGATTATVMGVLKIVVAGGGDTKRGRVNILYDA
jgi:hypothetical protein